LSSTTVSIITGSTVNGSIGLLSSLVDSGFVSKDSLLTGDATSRGVSIFGLFDSSGAIKATFSS